MAAIAIRLAVRPHLITVAAISLAALKVVVFNPVSTAFAQTPAPINVFDTDLAEIKPDAIGKLKDAIGKLKDAIEKAKANPCYPPPVKFTVVTPNVGDPLFVETLANARVEA